MGAVRLKSLCNGKLTVGVLIKWRYPFYTDLNNFVKPQNAALIGVFGEPLRSGMKQSHLDYFDHVFWFKTDYEVARVGSSDTDSVRLPEIDSAIREIAQIIDPTRLRLIVGEELVIHTGALLREELGIPGAKPSDLKRIRDKVALKEFAVANGVPTAKHHVIDFNRINSAESEAAAVQASIGTYPIFAKPAHGVGAAGSATLSDTSALTNFIRETSEKSSATANAPVYLFEENLEGTEFWAQGSLLKDGSYKVIVVDYMPRAGAHTCIYQAKPLFICAARPPHAEELMPGVLQFCAEVVAAFKPYPMNHLTVQGFHLRGTGEFRLTEFGYRIPGMRGCTRSYYACGLSHETAQMSLVLDDDYVPQADEATEALHVADVWFGMVKGRLQSRALGGVVDKLSSVVKERWMVDVGKEMRAAESIVDMAVAVHVFNKDRQTCLDDAAAVYESVSIDISD